MKTIYIFLLSIIFVPVLLGQIPRTISYQGVLSDALGNPKPDGDYTITFSFYEAQTGGDATWTESKTLNLTKGLFSTSLGDQVVFGAELIFDKPYWLGIKVANESELSPRIALTSSGYSLTSDNALDVADGKVVKSLNGLKDAVNLEGSGGTTITTTDNKITISSSDGGSGIQGVVNTNNTIAITDPNGPTTTVNLKVPLAIGGSGNYNTFSSSNSTTGNGIYGESNSGYGIIGHSNTNIGVEGRSASGYGVSGHYDQGGTTFGALGVSISAVYGYTDSGSDAYAGYFSGYVFVSDDLSVGGDKNFKIDHPLDPSNKYLLHSCVESFERMNIYNGNITTDANGFATVELPEYFETLNIDYHYQLTTIGQQAQSWIDNEIQNNRFTIKTDKQNIKVSWQVTGVRNDEHAKQNPFIVEQEKEEFAKGKYLQPKLFGQPKEMGIHYVKNPYETQK